jgi:hypothetical protein
MAREKQKWSLRKRGTVFSDLFDSDSGERER